MPNAKTLTWDTKLYQIKKNKLFSKHTSTGSVLSSVRSTYALLVPQVTRSRRSERS